MTTLKSSVLVSGASSGIGEATCRLLVENQYKVIGVARNQDKLSALSRKLGQSFQPVVLDVTDAEAIDEWANTLSGQGTEIDVLINNAGHDIGGRRSFEQGTAQQWCDIIETNVRGLIRMTHAVIHGMLERGHGHVVNLGSIAGLRPYATGTAYTASKFAVHGLSECLRLDYAGKGIRITEIMPGLVRTDFANQRLGGEEKAAEFYDSFDQCLNPEDVADTVLYVLQQPKHVEIAQLVVLPVTDPSP